MSKGVIGVLTCLAMLLFRMPDARADEPGSYVKSMQVCDALSLAPLALSALFLGGQIGLAVYAHADTFFEHEERLVLGASALTAAGYVACGPATHLVHGRADRALASAGFRLALPMTAIALTAGLSRADGDGWPVGTVVGSAGIIGSVVGALLIDYSLAARSPVTPTVSVTPNAMSAGLGVVW